MNISTLSVLHGASSNSTTPSVDVVNILSMCVDGFSFLLGFPTHCYVICLILRGAGNGLASEFLILNLSICEAGFAVSCLSFVLSNFFSFIIDFKLFLVGLLTTGRPLFQCLICVERYLAVVHPVTFLRYKPLRYRLVSCAVAWILVLGGCLCCMYTMLSYLFVHIWFLLLQFISVLFIQLFCLVAVLKALKQSGLGEKSKMEENQMKRRAFILILLNVICMVVTYVPYNVSAFVTIITKNVIPAQWLVGLIFYVASGFVPPVLFLNRIGKLSNFSEKLSELLKSQKNFHQSVQAEPSVSKREEVGKEND